MAATQALTKIPVVSNRDGQLHSFQVRRISAVIPLPYNGSDRIGLLAMLSPVQLGGPFGFCAFAWLSPILPGSLKTALKRTRPRLRLYMILVGIL